MLVQKMLWNQKYVRFLISPANFLYLERFNLIYNFFCLDQYKQAWKLIGQRGTEKDAELAFKRTDIDDSGYIDWNEFLFSILGDDAGGD